MSVVRDALARVHGIPAEQVQCANCARHREFINELLWCDRWNASARADEFCSLYVRESEGKAEPTQNKTPNALNALEQENTDFFTKGHLHLGYVEEGE